MVRKVAKWMPGGPLTLISFHVGWLLVGMGVLLPLLVDGRLIVANTQDFLSYINYWLVSGICLVAGFFVAKPGCGHRTLKALGGVFACMMWMGVSVWPLFTESDAPISIIGALVWLCFSSLLINDSFSEAYTHEGGRCTHH